MSIETRLVSLQSKVDELLELSKKKSKSSRNLLASDQDLCEPGDEFIIKSPQAEIRSLELWRSVVNECLGTLCFVFFVCGVSIPWTGHFPPFLSVAFVTALAYGTLTFAVFPRAHLNPIFSLALTAIQRMSSLRCFLFIAAQAGGAVAGAAILYGLTVPGYQGTLGATTIASHVEPMQAFGLELILSFVLTLTFVSDPTNCLPTTCILLAANLVAIPCTGGSLNPVRSLGPAFVMNKWPRHWVFWVGPTLGALGASYLHRYILRRDNLRGKKKRNNRAIDGEIPSDGVSLDIPPTELMSNIGGPDRLLCESRFEPIYGGTRSLYLKPSPVLPRTNLNRSQSVYASKRYVDYPSKLLDSSTTPITLRKKHGLTSGGGISATTPQMLQQQLEANYESLYPSSNAARSSGKCGSSTNQPSGLLVSGPPSYESSYFKTYSTHSDSKTHSLTHGSSHHYHPHHGMNLQQQHSSGGGHHSHQHHHVREKSLDSQSNHNHHHLTREQRERERQREREANRILAQYDISNTAAHSKVLADLADNPKIALNSQSKSIYYESTGNGSNVGSMRKHNAMNYKENHPDKKLMDTSSSSCESSSSSGNNHSNSSQHQNSYAHSNNGTSNPAPPPRFRPPIQVPIEESPLQQQQRQQRYPPSGSETPNDLSRDGQQQSIQPRKPYEHLDSMKLLDFSPKQQQQNTTFPQQQQQNNYTPRILAAEKDSTYSRILEPLLNSSKPPPPPPAPSAIVKEPDGSNNEYSHSRSSQRHGQHHHRQSGNSHNNPQQSFNNGSKQYQGYCPVPLTSGSSSSAMSPNQHDHLTFSYH